MAPISLIDNFSSGDKHTHSLSLSHTLTYTHTQTHKLTYLNTINLPIPILHCNPNTLFLIYVKKLNNTVAQTHNTLTRALLKQSNTLYSYSLTLFSISLSLYFLSLHVFSLLVYFHLDQSNNSLPFSRTLTQASKRKAREEEKHGHTNNKNQEIMH